MGIANSKKSDPINSKKNKLITASALLAAQEKMYEVEFPKAVKSVDVQLLKHKFSGTRSYMGHLFNIGTRERFHRDLKKDLERRGFINVVVRSSDNRPGSFYYKVELESIPPAYEEKE